MSDFRNSTVYQIYIKSFCDSNGDGIGDLNGIRSRLDYLKDLGVDYLWITPFFLSPMNDNGYDVADYYSINPMFGTMDDADALIQEAADRGIGLMFDMVFNHTSTDHEWFQKALAGDPVYMDYYIFKDPVDGHAPTNWESKFGGNAWEYVPSLGKYYLHLFDVSQADLNWENPVVREELAKVLRFWKKKGVSGFRFDVVNLISKPFVYEDDHQGDGRRFYTDGPKIHQYLKELVEAGGIAGDMTVGEMSSTSLDNCVRYANPAEKELKMVFSFHHLKVDYKDGQKWALKAPDYAELRSLFKTWQEGMQAKDAWNALFWCNHDQPRAVSRFCGSTGLAGHIRNDTFVCFVRRQASPAQLADLLAAIVTQASSYLDFAGMDSLACAAMPCEGVAYEALLAACTEQVNDIRKVYEERRKKRYFRELIELRSLIYAAPEITFEPDKELLPEGKTELYRESYKKCFGISFHQDCIAARCARAKCLLAATQMELSEISEKCGYVDHKYFQRQFAAVTGIPAMQYRSLCKA